MRLKGRILVHVNRDVQKDILRSDSASADMITVRLVIILSPTLGLKLTTSYMRDSYMQSGPISRYIYSKKPRNCHRKRGIVLKLLKLPNCMTDASIQCLLSVVYCMLGASGISRVDGVNQIFFNGYNDGINLITAKIIDDFLILGNKHDIKEFIKEFSG